MTQMIGGLRPMRVCEVCGGYDDHPRHVVESVNGEVGVPSAEVIDTMVQNEASGQAIAEAMDPTTQMRHLDCCRDAGCPDGSCETQLEGAEGKTGKELLTFLLRGQS